jgi:hypothetical protein
LNLSVGSEIRFMRLELAEMPGIEIRALDASPDIREALSEILVETVANGGSVSFMHPLAVEVAHTFWSGSLAAAARGERIVPSTMRA